MGYYELSGSDNPKIKRFTSRVGTIITLLNYLDYNIQIFIEAILNLENDKNVSKTIISLIRTFDLSRRLNFLKSLIKNKHQDKFEEYCLLHDNFVKISEIRNYIAHSQVYFWDDPNGTHMMISNMKKSELPPEKAYNQITIKQLSGYVKEFRKNIDLLSEFTYDLGYFQG